MKGSTKQAIMLCAHWDCRPWSDEEKDESKRLEPVMGANDGASGVGVILEMVRQISALRAKGEWVPSICVVFFDCEDMGTPAHYTGPERRDTWCLGSQIWAKEYANNKADSTRLSIQYGILLDMVGDPSATFPIEYYSAMYAASYVEKLWRTASQLGYGRYFTYQQVYPITDDHYYVNTLAGIPCLDVIDYKANSETGFSDWWHTLRDDMQNINKQTLKAVGETVMTTICSK
jgi:Zn-dependent M28 family amino/carboxypeptidase